MDRETMAKKIDRLQKEIVVLQHKNEELAKKESEVNKEPGRVIEHTPSYQVYMSGFGIGIRKILD